MNRFGNVYSYQICSCTKCGVEQAYYFGTPFEFEVYSLYKFNEVYCTRCFDASDSLSELFVDKVDGVLYISGQFVLFSWLPFNPSDCDYVYLRVKLPDGVLESFEPASRVLDYDSRKFGAISASYRSPCGQRNFSFDLGQDSKVRVKFLSTSTPVVLPTGSDAH